MAHGAARPAVRGREPAGRRHQYRDRSGRAGARGRLHAASRRAGERDQRHALRQAQLRFHPRHGAGGGPHPLSQRNGGQSVGSGQDRPRVRRLRQGQSRQDQLCLVRQWIDDPHVGRAVQDDGGRRPDARALSRRCAGTDRHAGGAGAGHVRQSADVDRAYPGRQAAAVGDHQRDTLGAAAGRSDRRRFRARLRVRARGTASARRRTRRRRSSIASTRRSTRCSSIPG